MASAIYGVYALVMSEEVYKLILGIYATVRKNGLKIWRSRSDFILSDKKNRVSIEKM